MAPGARYSVLVALFSILSIPILRHWHFILGWHFNTYWSIPRPSGLEVIDIASYHCEHSYTVELLSIDPFVIYLNDFVTEAEIQYLLALGQGRFAQSLVTRGRGEHLSLTIRRSQTAVLPAGDIVCNCLQETMKSLLGNVQHEEVVNLQLVKYAQGTDTYRLHTDWVDIPSNDTLDPKTAEFRLSRRLGSIFVYLEDNCTHGEIYFPELTSVSETADGNKFAIPEAGTGLIVKPWGNAIFWNNLHANASGDVRVAHSVL